MLCAVPKETIYSDRRRLVATVLFPSEAEKKKELDRKQKNEPLYPKLIQEARDAVNKRKANKTAQNDKIVPLRLIGN